LPPEANQLPIQAIAIIAIAIPLVIAVFGLAFRKGYIRIEVVDEEGSDEKAEDFSI
jgi:hypothetical protein